MASDPNQSSQMKAFFRLIVIIIGSVWTLSFLVIFYEADLQVKECFHQAKDITGSEKARSQILMGCEESAAHNTLIGRVQGVNQILHSNQPLLTKVYVVAMSLLPIKIR